MSNRSGTHWLVNAEYSTPEQNLIAAVIHKAVRDAQHASPAIRADALRYLRGRNFENDCAWLDLNAQRVRILLEVTQ